MPSRKNELKPTYTYPPNDGYHPLSGGPPSGPNTAGSRKLAHSTSHNSLASLGQHSKLPPPCKDHSCLPDGFQTRAIPGGRGKSDWMWDIIAPFHRQLCPINSSRALKMAAAHERAVKAKETVLQRYRDTAEYKTRSVEKAMYKSLQSHRSAVIGWPKWTRNAILES